MDKGSHGGAIHDAMIYIFVYAGAKPGEAPEEIERASMSEDLRPRVGDQIQFKSIPNEVFRITKSQPSGNPENLTVTYFVEPMSDVNRIAGGSIADFGQYYLDTRRGGSESAWTS